MTELFRKRFEKLKADSEKIFLNMKTDDLNQIFVAEKSVAALIFDFIAKMMEFNSTSSGESKLTPESEHSMNSIFSKEKWVNSWDQTWSEFYENLDPSNFGQNENHAFFDRLLILLSDCALIYGQMVLVFDKYISPDLKPGLLNEQQNSSPVCFAKSDEIRDEYRR